MIYQILIHTPDGVTRFYDEVTSARLAFNVQTVIVREGGRATVRRIPYAHSRLAQAR